MPARLRSTRRQRREKDRFQQGASKRTGVFPACLLRYSFTNVTQPILGQSPKAPWAATLIKIDQPPANTWGEFRNNRAPIKNFSPPRSKSAWTADYPLHADWLSDIYIPYTLANRIRIDSV